MIQENFLSADFPMRNQPAFAFEGERNLELFAEDAKPQDTG